MSESIFDEVPSRGWCDEHLFALTRSTVGWTPAGDWWDARNHCLPLYTIAKNVNWMDPTWPGPAQPPRCLEIGVREGPTTMALLHAMRETGGSLISIECDPDVADITRGLVDKAGLSRWWNLQVTRSEVFAAQAPPVLDLLWIDGDHSEAQVRRDVTEYAHRVRMNGFMCLHDFWSDAACMAPPRASGFPSDVSVVVEEIRVTGEWEILTFPWSFGLTMCRRIRWS